MRTEVLGFPVDILSKSETIEKISGWLKTPSRRPKIVATAYSEFYVKATTDTEFGKILRKADLVTPDGVSVLAAVRYKKRTQGIKNSRTQGIKNSRTQGIKNSRTQGIKNSRTQGIKNSRIQGVVRVARLLGEGLRVGGEILGGKMGEPVTGVWLFDELTRMAKKRGWKIFLLGGWDNVSERAATKLLERLPGLRIVSDGGETRVGTDRATDERIVKKINAFKPDILFVQYRPVIQEKWIDSHLDQLKVGVAMGIGGTLDEYVGNLANSPKWMERRGLKWLWRLIIQPRRWRRMIDAVIVFPWLVFKSSL